MKRPGLETDTDDKGPKPIDCNPMISLATRRRSRTGKVARLPKNVRDAVNQSLLDGAPYSAIIMALERYGVTVNEDNLANWKKGGFQDWLKHEDYLDRMRLTQDFALDLVETVGAGAIHEATLQVAVFQLCQILQEFDPAAFKAKLRDDPALYPRLLTVLSKLSGVGLKREAQRDSNFSASLAAQAAFPIARKHGLPDFDPCNPEILAAVLGRTPPKSKRRRTRTSPDPNKNTSDESPPEHEQPAPTLTH